MRFNLDISKHLTGATGKGLMLHGQALALCMPYIIAEELPDLHVFTFDNNVVGLIDRRYGYKVICGRNDKFDLNPSKTKGIGRETIKVNSAIEKLKEHFDKVILVDINDIYSLTITVMSLDDKAIPDSGKIDLNVRELTYETEV